MNINEIHAYQIYDSRGLPTVACDIILNNAIHAHASVPSGASVGIHEALELRDGGSAFMGKGVSTAIDHIHKIIAPALIGKELDAIGMDKIIKSLDPSPQKKELGANATLAVSMALFRAHAQTLGVELYDFIARSLDKTEVTLPIPVLNFINGGAHAHNNLAIQEYMIIPYGAHTFAQAMTYAVEIFYALKKLLQEHNKPTYTGDEGGFAPSFANSIEPLEFLMRAIERANIDSSTVALGLDVAASQFYNEVTCTYTIDQQILSANALIDFYDQLMQKFPIIYLEDPCAQDDWTSWQEIQKRIGNRATIIGDDLLVTQSARMLHALKNGAAHGAIIKPNQVGTVSESLEFALLCQEHQWTTVASHRSGETCDCFIADFALGVGANYIKCGGCSHGERLAKYNRLLQVENLYTESSL